MKDRDHGPVREQIAQACRDLADRGLVIGAAGNISVRAGDRVVVTATEARFDRMTPEQVVVVDLDGNRISGDDPQPTSEMGLHLGVYRQSDASAVVHTHAPMATAVGLVVDELPCVHYYMLQLGGSVRVAPYATWGTPELAGHVLAALHGRSAALMANHGALTHGHDLATALERTLLLEWACTLYWRAASMGTPRALDDDQQHAVIAALLARTAPQPTPVPRQESP